MVEVFRFQEPEIALEDERPNPGAPNAQGLTDAASLNNPAKLEQSAAFLQRCVALSERGVEMPRLSPYRHIRIPISARQALGFSVSFKRGFS
jgi:hypothetical protein